MPNPKVTPIVQVNVYEEQAYSFLQYPAYGGRFRFDSIAKRDLGNDPDETKSFIMEYVSQEALQAAGCKSLFGGVDSNNSKYVPCAQFIPSPVECVISTPFVDLTQGVDLDYFHLMDNFQTGWHDELQDEQHQWIDPNSVMCHNNYHGYTTYAGTWSGVLSAFQYPADPIICLAIYRTAPSSTIPTGVTPCTLVYFGISPTTVFCLQLNYNKAPLLWIKHEVHTNGKWRYLQAPRGSSPLKLMENPTWRGQPNPPLLWIMPAAGGIAVSDDAFSSVTFFPLRWTSPDANHPWGAGPLVPAGPIWLRHNAGQWGFSVVPTRMMTAAFFQTPLVPTPFDIAAPLLAELPFCNLRQDNLYDITGVPIPGGAARAYLTLNLETSRIPGAQEVSGPNVRHAVEYQIGIPGCVSDSHFTKTGNSKRTKTGVLGAPGASYIFRTMNCPRIYDLIYGQTALVVNPDTPAVASKEVKAFSISRSCDRLDFDGDVTLDAKFGREAGLVTVERPRAVAVAGYWADKDNNIITPVGGQAQCAGFVSEAHTSGRDGDAVLTLPVHGWGKFLTGSRRVSDTFPLDWLPVNEALAHCASWCGIPATECNFEDLGMTLNGGPHDSELFWYAESGDRIESLMKEICLYACNTALWVAEDGKLTTGCPHCRTQRTAATLSSHFGQGPASAGCRAADVIASADPDGIMYRFITNAAVAAEAGVTDLDDPMSYHCGSVDKPSLSVEQYFYNCIRIKGPSYGKPDDSATSDLTDNASVLGDKSQQPSNGFTLGYKRTWERTYPWACTKAIRDRVTVWLYDQMRRRPEFCEVVVPYTPEVTLGDTFRVWGNTADDVGASGRIYRTWSYSHKVMPRQRIESATTLLGRFMDYAPTRAPVPA